MPTPLKIERLTLVVGAVTSVYSPYPCYRLRIGNATLDDLKVLSQSADTGQYSVIASGFEDTFENTGHYLFEKGIVCYLLSAVGGDVVLKWI